MTSDLIPLRCEICPTCKKHIQMHFPKSEINPGLTGLATIIDIHGLSYRENPHIRILYVDPHGSVRSFKSITEITGDANILEEIKNLKGIF